MTFRSCFRLAVFLAVVVTAQEASAQGPRTVSIDPAGESARVFLSYLDAAAYDNYAKMFEIPMYMDYKPFALLLTNASGQSIVALTVRWTGTSAGRSCVYDSSSNSLHIGAAGTGSSMSLPMPGQEGTTQAPRQIGRSFLSANGPVVATHGERMLVAPGLFAKQGSASGSSSIPAALLSAEVVSATLDLVVLEDGTVLGPDASNTVGDLRARKAAIDSMVNAVRAAEQNGQDGVEVLRQLARPPRLGGPEAMQLSAIAHSLMISRQWREGLERLAAIQLPNFHR